MKYNNWTTLLKIIKISWESSQKLFVALFIMNMLGILFPIMSMLNTQFLMNGIQMHFSFFSSPFLILLISFFSINILNELNRAFLTIITNRESDVLNYQFSKRVLKKVNTQSLKDFENPDFYNLVQRAETAGGTQPNSIVTGLIGIAVNSIGFVSYVVILASWKWWSIFVIVLFPLLSSLQIYKQSKYEFEILYKRANIERKSWYYAHLMNKDTNIKETRLFSLENYLLKKFCEIRELFIKENTKMSIRRSKIVFSIQIISIISSGVLILLIFYQASKGMILLGSLMTLINSIISAKSSSSTIINFIFGMHQSSLYAGNIVELLDYKGLTDSDNRDRVKKIDQINSIVLENVSYKYLNSNEKALNNINLKFDVGKNYTVVGRNGSGKSTLMKILLGLYSDYSGIIKINGVDLKEIDLQSYKKKLSTIFQDFTNYQFSVAESISISEPNAMNDIDRIKESADKATATNFIMKLPNQFYQQIGNWFEGGVQISGGEFQKLAIARAFYRDKASMIILDEPSSALDPFAESGIYRQFGEMTKDKIGIFVTHRLKNFNIEGDIIVLDNGEIAEQGHQTELLDKKGMFYRLYNTQNTVKAG